MTTDQNQIQYIFGRPLKRSESRSGETWTYKKDVYGLLFSFSNSNGIEKKIEEVLYIQNLKNEWQNRRQKLLADKIDVTAFMVWFVGLLLRHAVLDYTVCRFAQSRMT